MIALYVILAVLLLMLANGIFLVRQQQVAVVQRFGRFQSMRKPGIQLKIPFVDRVAGKLSIRIQQLDVMVETKTKDDVFVKIKVSVQYMVLKEKIYEAFYQLEDPHAQITSYVFDTVRAEVPKLKLDDVFEKKNDIANAVKSELEEAMDTYGYGIVKALVTDIDPDEEVKHAMNRINAAERNKTAAEYEGEAERIRIVAKAHAEAESKRLQGQGIADQRREIARGLEESVNVLNKVGINSQEASSLIVITQHYDTLDSVSENSQSNLILMPNSPATASTMLNDMLTSFAASSKLGEQQKAQKEEKEEKQPAAREQQRSSSSVSGRSAASDADSD